MSDPAVEAQAGGYSNAALDHYVNDGPTANKNKNAGKSEDLYAKVDMSKKCKKKKVIYFLSLTIHSSSRFCMPHGKPGIP